MHKHLRKIVDTTVVTRRMNLLLHYSCVVEILAMTVYEKSIQILLQHGQLITTNSFLASLPDKIIDNIINDMKHDFTDHVWYELQQRGI